VVLVCVGFQTSHHLTIAYGVGANLTTIAAGGWFPIVVSFTLTIIMVFWSNGQDLLNKALRDESLSDEDVTSALKDVLAARVSGTGLFFTPEVWKYSSGCDSTNSSITYSP